MNLLSRKVGALVRLGMVHFLSSRLPLYIVNEFPKSGGSWFSQMLGCALGVPFPRNRLPSLRPSIMQGHYINPWGLNNVTIVWRDGRDVMVSWYYYSLFVHDLEENAPLVKMVRKDLPFEDYDNIEENLPAFLEYAFTRPRHPRFSWSDFVRRWHGRKGVVHTSYEDLRRDTAGELQRVVIDLTAKRLEFDRATEIADEFSFARQSGRNPGEENNRSFLRKGVVEDWRNNFTQEACDVFDRYAGDELIRLGYERDRAWVSAT